MNCSVLLRRVSGVAVCALALGTAVQAAGSSDEPGAWLARMNEALSTRNYEGTFFHLSQGQVETLRIVHRVHGGRVTERLSSLDGSGREFVRTNDELTCYLPDQKTVLVEPRREKNPFLGSLPQFNADVGAFYRIEALPAGRVMGRVTRVISVSPKDQFRFGYRLWLDEQTAMPLKTQLCDARGQVVEQIIFANLEMPESIPENAVQPSVRTEGMRWVRQGVAAESPVSLAAFRASQLPPGFRLTVSRAQTLGDSHAPAAHLVYSDGLATVSVFVEPGPGKSPGEPGHAAAAPAQALSRVGAGYAFSTVVQGHQVTAVGEVPAQTVEFIAHSMTANGSPR